MEYFRVSVLLMLARLMEQFGLVANLVENMNRIA